MAGKVRRFYRKHKDSMKATGAQAAGGVAVAFIDKQFFSSETGKNLFGSSTYVKPIVILAGAHLVKSKAPNLGAGMAGAAGYMLMQSYFANSAPKNENPVQGIQEEGNPQLNPFQRRDIYQDAGIVYEYQPTG